MFNSCDKTFCPLGHSPFILVLGIEVYTFQYFFYIILKYYLLNVPELEPAVDDGLLRSARLLRHQLQGFRLVFGLRQGTRLPHTPCGRVVARVRHLSTSVHETHRENNQLKPFKNTFLFSLYYYLILYSTT